MSAIDLTPDEARAILGLPRDAGPEAVMGAFRAAAKLAHPDRGGDPARFLEILCAYRLLQSLPQRPRAATSVGAEPPVAATFTAYAEISPMVALTGGEAEALLADGRRLPIKVPAGARHGEALKVDGETVRLRIRAESAMQVRGSDVWISAEVATQLLHEGGRAVVPTPLGERMLWITGKVAERRLVRLEGEGLPARDGQPQGSLYIRLVPDTGAPESAARTQLKKFAAAWAA
jgi:curved DNA-binding protein